MSRLVIAEKPSVAQSIASVLGAGNRKDGYLEGGGYLVSWCFGHLAELSDASAYNPDYAKWRYETCRSCRRNGSIRWPPTRKSSLTC